jgi:hypothetical protein
MKQDFMNNAKLSCFHQQFLDIYNFEYSCYTGQYTH